MPVVTPSAFSRVPPPGTPAGDERRDQFYHDLLAILGPTQLLWTPETGDTTTSTSRDRYGVTITYDATVASRFSPLGSLWALDFDGTDDEADTPDLARFTFGDGGVDQPFSIVALVNSDDISALRVILAKWDDTTSSDVQEWILYIDENGSPTFLISDQSTLGVLGRSDATAITVGTWYLLVATYDGIASSTSIRIYLNAVRVDDTSNNSGSYAAMENTAQEVQLGFYTGASGPASFWNGKLAFVALTGKALSPDENHVIKELINAVADLSL